MESLFSDTSNMESYHDGYYDKFGDPNQYVSSSNSAVQHQIPLGFEYCQYQNEANLDQLLYSEIGGQKAAIIELDTDQSYGSYASEAAFDSNGLMAFADEAVLLSYLCPFGELKNIQFLPIVSEMENNEKLTNETIEYCPPVETTIENKELNPEQLIKQKFSTKKTTSKTRKRNHLVQHTNVHHSGPRDHRCDECGKRFHALEELHCHVQRHVAREKPYKCVECPRQFNYVQNLERHCAVHHGVAKHACRHCGKRMARRDHLMAHEATHRRRNGCVKLAK